MADGIAGAMACRVCGAASGAPILAEPGPSITSLSTVVPSGTTLHLCRACGHAQKPAIADLASFYDTGYRISLDSEDHDQLYEHRDGRPVFRTVKQAELVLALAPPPPGARVLDYGAAKAATLARLVAARPDIRPHVFDVSRDYETAWAGWLPPEARACYEPPAAWAGRFDLVTAHFVLEHVGDPVSVLRRMAGLLAPSGELFITVPDPLANPGDLMVADHVNAFTAASLTRAAREAGLSLRLAPPASFRGAHVALLRRGGAEPPAPPGAAVQDPAAAAAAVAALVEGWRRAAAGVARAAAEPGPAAIYGAGFYGAWIGLRLGLGTPDAAGGVVCFLDANPHVHGGRRFGLPVLDAYGALPPVRRVFAGLNPTVARSVMARWTQEIGRPDLAVICLDD
jgi:SAM-dependent methyltransferase